MKKHESKAWYEELTQEKLEQYLLDIAKAKEDAQQVLPDNPPTRETIAEAVEYVFNQLDIKEKAKKRQFKILAGCRTFGTTDLKTRICNDPECQPCSTFTKEVKRQVEQWNQK